MTKRMFPEIIHVYQNHHLDSTRWNVYKPRDNDIIISSSYKSGTTWTQSIIRELIVYSIKTNHINTYDTLPLEDSYSSIWIDKRTICDIETLSSLLEGQKYRRFIKTHLPLDGLPYFPQVKYIVLGRDPRDVFMSFWNNYYGYSTSAYDLYNNTPGRNGPKLPICPEDIHVCWKNWISKGWFEWEKEGFPFWGNMHHTQTWWNYRYLNNIQFLNYADLLKNKSEEIKRIADYIEIDISNKAIESIIDITDIKNMRQRGMKHNSICNEFKKGADTFFNKGTNKRWKNVLSEDELVMYEKKKREILTRDCASWLENGRKS